MHRLVLPLAACVLALPLAACTSTSRSGPDNAEATYNKVTGNLETTADRPLDEVYEATRRAMNDLEFRLVDSESAKDALQGRVSARDARDNKITVDLRKVSDAVTSITVNLGAFADESKARMIADRIKGNL